jgi:hypothetical protein
VLNVLLQILEDGRLTDSKVLLQLTQPRARKRWNP